MFRLVANTIAVLLAQFAALHLPVLLASIVLVLLILALLPQAVPQRKSQT